MSEVETPSFVANYPPFGAWSEEAVGDVLAAMDRPPVPGTALGLYVHVPFCRQRCRFCYYKVYTERPASEIRAYVAAVTREAAAWARRPFVGGRRLRYVYVGGGTPSYLSGDQIRELFDGLFTAFEPEPGAELTYECEPGTVRPPKVAALAALGVTRVSLGVESWDDGVLALNGRAHEAKHVEPAYQMCRDAGIPQINIDLLAGMVGETDATWAHSVERTLELSPDSVTIYQLEIPGNTAIARALRGEEDLGGAIADVPTRRRWASEAFRALVDAGYTMTSGYTAVKGDPTGRFVYRDALWHGADMVPLGVSSFGHVGGVHAQNVKRLPEYLAAVERDGLALQRGHRTDADERLIREWVLRLKLGRVHPSEFRAKFGVDPLERFAAPLRRLRDAGWLSIDGDDVTLSWDGLMRVDALLPSFFRPEHGGPA